MSDTTRHGLNEKAAKAAFLFIYPGIDLRSDVVAYLNLRVVALVLR